MEYLMDTVCEKNMCNGCMACIDACPKNCISIVDTIDAYNAIRDTNQCINCGLCEKICPNNIPPKKNEPIIWKQGWAESEIRINSSSGGAASAIIRAFIESGGYVASCLFKDGEFIFDITDDIAMAKKFAGSKYVKSNPVGIYKKIRERLKTDKVLFVGLPCQVAGLTNFIRNQENLYTIDLICHGTPSPRLLNKFLSERNVKIKECLDIKFRANTRFGLRIEDKEFNPEGTDDYLLTFLDAINYTDNCYSCQYAEVRRISDITLGDSWGTEYKEEEKSGVSLILVQTDKGKELLSNAKLILKDVNKDIAIRENHQLKHPSLERAERKVFLDAVAKGKTYSFTTFSLYKRLIIKRNIKKILMKLHLYSR